jgi:hypothetical protein
MRITRAGAFGIAALAVYVVLRAAFERLTFPTYHTVHLENIARFTALGVIGLAAIVISMKKPDANVASNRRAAVGAIICLVAGYATWISFGRNGAPLWDIHPLAFYFVLFAAALTASSLQPRRFWIGPIAFSLGELLFVLIRHGPIHGIVPILLDNSDYLVLGAAIPVLAAEIGRWTKVDRSRFVAETAAVAIAAGAVLSLFHWPGCSANHWVIPSTRTYRDVQRALIATLLSKDLRITEISSRGNYRYVSERVDGCRYRTPFAITIGRVTYERETATSRTYTRSTAPPLGFDDPLRVLPEVLMEIDHVRGKNGSYTFDSGEPPTHNAYVGAIGSMTIRHGLVRRFVEGLPGRQTTYVVQYHQRIPPVTPPPKRLVRPG